MVLLMALVADMTREASEEYDLSFLQACFVCAAAILSCMKRDRQQDQISMP
jgi:hypothetical protein